jgi:DNA-binding CsgD family transcriptional regulator
MDDRSERQHRAASRPNATTTGTDAGALVGREAELQRVVDLLRRDRPVAVIGEAGIGKTTLVRAAAKTAGRVLYEGGGFATLAWMPYLAVRRAIGRGATGDPVLVAAQVERVVGPDLLLIDDLQWTDPATREVVALLASRIAIVVTVREGDAAAAETLASLESLGVERVRLHGLDDQAATVLARRVHPDATPAQLQGLVERAGGNPLLLGELATRGQSSSSVARAIVGQVERLAPADRRALQLLALADRPLPADAIGPAAARLRERGLVRVEPDGLLVRHALIAEAIVNLLDTERRRELHARLADIVHDPAERARHLVAAGRRAEAFEVARSALEATTEPRTRAVLLAVAAETSELDASAWRVRAAMQLRAIGSPAEAIALLREPIDGDDDLQALGASVLAGSLDHEGRNDEAWAVIEGARHLRLAPASEGAIELALIEGVVLVNRGRLDDALAVAERADAAAGDPGSRAGARERRLAGHLAALRLYAGRTDRLDELEQVVAASLKAADGDTAAGRSMDLYYMTLALRGAAVALAVASRVAERLEDLGFHTRAAELRAESAQAAIFAGDLRAALIHVDTMLETPLGLLSRQRLGYNRGLVLGLLGRFEDAERTFMQVEAEATDTFDGRGALSWCWSEVALWSGQPGRALDLAEASLAYTAFNDAEFVLPSLARAWAETELGRQPTASAVGAPFRGLAGAQPELRGLTAGAHGEHTVAAAAFDEAAALWAEFHVPRELLCRWAAAEARRRAGDLDHAVPELEETLAAADAIGFEPLSARIRRSLRLGGVRVAARRGHGPVAILTAREAEVAGLVEQGLSNGEIARRLGLGRPTVVRLVASAMAKLGLERRAQLAASELA